MDWELLVTVSDAFQFGALILEKAAFASQLQGKMGRGWKVIKEIFICSTSKSTVTACPECDFNPSLVTTPFAALGHGQVI